MVSLCNVLIVEDQYLIAVDLIETMACFGAVRTEMALDSQTAHRFLDAEVFDLVILDYHLGADTCHLLVERLRPVGTPVIVVTGADFRSLPAWLFDYPVLAKPINYRAVGAAVRSLGFGVSEAV